MKIFRINLILVIFFGLSGSLLAQQTKESAEKEFENYGTQRTLGQTSTNSSSTSNRNRRKKRTTRRQNNRKGTTRVSKKQDVRVGSRGIKISFQKQEQCQGGFNIVPTNSVFESGDCIRANFMLNFDGYLTIINLGTSGKNEVIYPANDLNAKLKAKTDYFIPDEEGWEFDDKPGNEQFIFIVSQNVIPQATIRKYLNERNSATENSDDFEVTTRNLKSRRENNSVYILVNAARNEDPLVFRMTIKHR